MSTGIQNTYKLHNDEIENQDIETMSTMMKILVTAIKCLAWARC